MSSVTNAVGSILGMRAPPAAPAPAIPPAPPPTIDNAARAGQDAADALRRRRGQASTVLAGMGGDSASTAPVTAAARLLGG